MNGYRVRGISRSGQKKESAVPKKQVSTFNAEEGTGSFRKLLKKKKKKKKELISFCSGFPPVNEKEYKSHGKKANLKQPQPRAKRQSKTHRPWTAVLLSSNSHDSCWTDPKGEDDASLWTSCLGVKLVQNRTLGPIGSTILQPKFSLHPRTHKSEKRYSP